jgi:SNF2 family DNA or RNA helicase
LFIFFFFTFSEDGSITSRELIRDYEFIHKDIKGIRHVGLGFEVCVTTYEMISTDIDYFRKINWRLLIGLLVYLFFFLFTFIFIYF